MIPLLDAQLCRSALPSRHIRAAARYECSAGARSRHGPPINRGPSVATPSHYVAQSEIFNSFIQNLACCWTTVTQGETLFFGGGGGSELNLGGLRRGSAAARLMGLWVRLLPTAWMSVSRDCCVLSGRGLCVGWSPVQRGPTECGVSECDREVSIMRRPCPTGGLLRHGNKKNNGLKLR
jgi:hypothetical protein